MTVTLRVADRLVLHGIMPQQSDFVTLLLAKDIQGKVAISQAEIADLELVSDSDRMTWNNEKDNGLEVNFTEAETQLIKRQLLELNDKKQVTNDHVGIYRIFVNG